MTTTLPTVESDEQEQEQQDALPKTSHPAVKAFFAALDNDQISSNNKQSQALQRRSQSLGWRNRNSQSDQYPVMVGSHNFTVKQVQRGEVEGTYGTGATVWPAAMVLVKYLERHPNLLVSKRVADLGSGTGITSVVAAILGAAEVICTDGEENVVALAKENIRHAATELHCTAATDNNDNDAVVMICSCPIHVQTYWWGRDKLSDGADVVLVADCVLPKLYPIAPLVEAIDDLLIHPDAVAILSYEHRWYPEYHPAEHFRALASARGLDVETIAPSQLDPVYCVDDIEIWHVTRKK